MSSFHTKVFVGKGGTVRVNHTGMNIGKRQYRVDKRYLGTALQIAASIAGAEGTIRWTVKELKHLLFRVRGCDGITAVEEEQWLNAVYHRKKKMRCVSVSACTHLHGYLAVAITDERNMQVNTVVAAHDLCSVVEDTFKE